MAEENFPQGKKKGGRHHILPHIVMSSTSSPCLFTGRLPKGIGGRSTPIQAKPSISFGGVDMPPKNQMWQKNIVPDWVMQSIIKLLGLYYYYCPLFF